MSASSSSCRSAAPRPGSSVSALVVIRLPRGSSRGFDERRWLRRQGVHVVLQGRRAGRSSATAAGSAESPTASVAGCARDAAPGLTGQRRAVIAGIVLGDDAALSPGLQESFRRSGLYHLLAVSGQNVVLLAAGVLGLAWLVGLPRGLGHVGALRRSARYVLAVGPQPSVIRAAVSGCAVSIAWLVARERDRWHVLALAAVVLLGWNPYLALRRRLPALVRRRGCDLPVRRGRSRASWRGIRCIRSSERRSRSRSRARW